MRYFLLHKDPSDLVATMTVRDLSAESEETLSGRFQDVFTEFLKRYRQNPVLVDNLTEMRKWDRLAETLGYDAFDASFVLDGRRLKQVLFPRRDPTSTPLSELSKQLLSVLGELPLITLQTMADAYPDWLALQTILNEWMLLRMKEVGLREEQVSVLHELAFRPVPSLLSGETEDDEVAPTNLEIFANSCRQTFLERTRQTQTNAFEDRPGQLQMLESVANALAYDQLLVIEAGTGTGKSLAYLLPSALFAQATREKVLVATHTIALQEQLRTKDIPLLQSLIGDDLRVALLKGRNHYVCLRKVARYTHSPEELLDGARDFVVKVSVWLSETDAGDREELSMTADEVEHWRLIQSETETCLNKKCPFFRHCYYFSAHERANEAHIVLANHSLVLSDLMTDHRILPAYQRLVLDEAHHLEDQATKQFGAEVTQFELQKLMDRLAGTHGILPDLRRGLAAYAQANSGEGQRLIPQVEQLNRLVTQAIDDTKAFFTALNAWLKQSSSKSEQRLTTTVVQSSAYQYTLDAVETLLQTNRQLATSLAELQLLIDNIEVEESLFERLEEVAGRGRELTHGLQVCIDVAGARAPETDFVGWAAKAAGDRVSLHLAPLSVAHILERDLFANKATVVLTSATLAVANSFQYLEDRVGLTPFKAKERLDERLVASPFAYREQALLCVPNDFPDVRDEAAFTAAVAEAIVAIGTMTRGRTMALFTSRQMLKQVHTVVEDLLKDEGIATLAQGIHDHRRSRLLEQFKVGNRTVLFGLDSFWEGVDVQGEALTSLIIVKLPFPVPSHPIMEARSELLRRQGKQPFREYSIPQAVIRFTQGFGRLIRSQSDRGVVFVLDKRIVTERYGRVFIESLPDIPVISGSLGSLCQKAKAYL